MIRIAVVLIGLGFAISGAFASEPQDKQPFELVRSIHALQDQVVLGNTAAQTALPRLIGQIADRLLEFDPEVWRDGKNARAAVAYVLSGGQPRVIRKILEIGNSPEKERKLMEGALAYAEGRESKAKQILNEFDARTLAPTVGGHVALTQSALVSRNEPRKAIQLLDIARMLAPGTLIEEAALRREIFLIDVTVELDKFTSLSSQYVRRFRNSVYADNFRQRFAASVVRYSQQSDVTRFVGLEKLLNEIDLDEQRKIYLTIAQAAIVQGKAEMARRAGEKALLLSKEGSVDAARSKLYSGAALILTKNFDRGLAALDTMGPSPLSKADVELKEATLMLVKQIRKWPDVPRAPAGADSKLTSLGVSLGENRELLPVASAPAAIDLAEKALSDVDDLLKRGAR